MSSEAVVFNAYMDEKGNTVVKSGIWIFEILRNMLIHHYTSYGTGFEYLRNFLTRDNENFVIIYKDGKQSVPPAGLKSISISKGAQITSDAAMLAIEREIEVLFVDNSGKPVGRIWSSKYGSVSSIRKNRLNSVFQ